MENSNEQKPLKALLVGIQLPRTTDQELRSSLIELSRLVTTLGYEVIGDTFQKRSSTKSKTVLGDGKLKDVAQYTGGTGTVAPLFVKKKHKAALKFKNDDEEDFSDEEELAENEPDPDFEKTDSLSDKAQIVIFDCDLSPAQLRNLESALGVPVLDRTGVIIEIFSRHARTKAARLQVEIARLTYVAPRVREQMAGDDRQEGGGGKGAGETSLELDRRKIRDRIKELKRELSSMSQEDDVRRNRRDQEISVALVGYTNAGKSSLMRALTGSEVYVADKLFATLDTTIRILQPETKPRILISDTVGFIKKLPHDLIASFKSTLDEAKHSAFLLFIVDASDPTFRSQLEVTKNTLAEVGAGNVESQLVLNKCDCLEPEQLQELKNEFPNALFISAKDPADIQKLHQFLVTHFEDSMQDIDILIPYDVQGAIGEVRSKLKVLSENYDERGVTLKIRGHEEDIERLRKRFGI